jgi:hypothetical protein
MSGRLKSAIFVAAWIRRYGLEGGFAVLRRRGAEDAGSIFIKIDKLDGTAMLYGPAPQSLSADDDGERRFIALLKPGATPLDAEERLQRELRYDSDLWIVEADDRQGRHFLLLAE